MYSVSALFKQYVTQLNREFEVKAVVGGTTYDNTVVVDFTIEDSAIPDQDFILGAAISSKLTIALRTTDNITINAEVQPYVRLNGSSGYTEWVPLGTFYIDYRSYQNGVWTFTCYDKLIEGQLPYASALSYPATFQAVWDECVSLMGLTSDASVVINPTYQVAAKPDGCTIRDILGYIASAHGASVRITKDGKLGWVKFSTGAPTTALGTSDYFSCVETNPLKTYTSIVLTYNDNGDTLTAGSGDSDHTLNLYNPFMTQTMLNNLMTALNNFSYQPMTMDWKGRPDIELGDALQITLRDGTVITTTVLTNSMNFKGGLKETTTAPSYAPQQSEFGFVGILQKITTPSGSVDGGAIAPGTITSISIAAATIGTAQIALAAIGTAQIADAAITSAKIQDATITSAKIANATITGANIANATIGTANIANAAITSAQIGSATITGANIASATITSANILDGTIQNADIANATIQGAKIANATITSAQIASATITGANIASATIATANIADAAITNAKISSLDASKITSGTISASLIGANTITTDKLLIGDFTNYASWPNKGTASTSPWDSRIIPDTTKYHTTTASLEIGPNLLAIPLKNTIPVMPGDVLYVDFWVMVASGWNGTSNNSKLRIGNAVGGSPLYVLGYGTATTSWTHFTGTYTVPSGVTDINVSLGNDGTSGNIWVDDIVIIKQSNTVSIQDGAITANKIAANTITANNLVANTITAGSGVIANAAITTALIADANITGAKIASATITSANIASATIGSAQIANGAITNAQIGNLAVSTAQIQDGAITSAKIANATITNADIANATITGANIASATITGANIANATIGTTQIATGAITTALIGNAAVGTSQIADASITDAKVVTLTASKLTAGTIDASLITVTNLNAANITVGTINGVQISSGTITSTNIANGTITGTNIASGTVSGSNISSGTITNNLISASTITGDKMVASTITGDKIAANTITANNLVANTITAGSGVIANAAIAGAQIASATITGANIASATITGANIATATITSANIQDGTITNADIANATIQGANIASATITGANIASATIADANIANLSATKITTGTLSASVIGVGTITSQKMVVGDYTNLCQINEVANPNGNATTVVNNYTYFKVGTAQWSSLLLFTTKQLEFKVGDCYYCSFNGYADLGTTIADVFLRYNYTDSTWANAGDVNLGTLPTTDSLMSATINITAAPDPTKTISSIQVRIQKDTADVSYIYVRNIELRKMYTGTLIVDGSITANELAANTITANKIAANTITASSGVIANAAITGAMIASATITSANIATGTITSAQIANATITGADIANATITSAQIASATITAANIATGTITSAQIANATIGTAQIADAAITSAKIANATIGSAQIGTITADKIFGGTLSLGGVSNGNGVLSIKDSTSFEIIHSDNTGLTVKNSANSNTIVLGNGAALTTYVGGNKAIWVAGADAYFYDASNPSRTTQAGEIGIVSDGTYNYMQISSGYGYLLSLGAINQANTGATSILEIDNNVTAPGKIFTSVYSDFHVQSNWLCVVDTGDHGYEIDWNPVMATFPGWDANMLYLNTFSNAGSKAASYSDGIYVAGGLQVDGSSTLVVPNAAPQRKIVHASSVVTPNSSGQAGISYGFTFSGVYQVMAVNGDGNAQANMSVSVVGTGTSSFTVQCKQCSSGASVTSAVRINWIAIGY